MNGAGDQNDGLAFVYELFSIGEAGEPWIGQAALDIDVTVQMVEGIRMRDGHRDEGTAFGALAQFGNAQTVARFFEQLEIRDYFRPIENRLVSADLVAEMAGRCGGRCGRAKYDNESC